VLYKAIIAGAQCLKQMPMASGSKVNVKGHATVLAGPSNGVSGSGKAVTVTIYTWSLFQLPDDVSKFTVDHSSLTLGQHLLQNNICLVHFSFTLVMI